MLIYNVTISVDEEVHEDWKLWMLQHHIPDMLATKKFSAAKMCRVLSGEHDNGCTYSVQYTTPSRTTLEEYYQQYAPQLRKEGHRLFPGKFVAFRTELELIDEQQA